MARWIAFLRRHTSALIGLVACAVMLFDLQAARAAEPTAPRDSLDIGEEPSVLAVALSPDGRLLAVYNNKPLKDKDKVLTLWDVAAKKQVAVLKSAGWLPSWDFCFTADGKDLIVGGSSAIIWDLASFKERRRIDDFEKIPDSSGHALFTPDGQSMILASTSRGLLVFDMATGKVAKSIQCDERPGVAEVLAVAVSPDGKMLAAGTKAGNVFVFDLEKGKQLQKFDYVGTAHGGGGCASVDLLAFSPDGTRLAAAKSLEAWVQVLDPATGKNLDTLRIYRDAVHALRALAYSPDGKTIAMVGNGTLGHQTVDLWDIDKFGFRGDFSGQRAIEGYMRCVVFSPDGKTVITGGDKVPVEFWDVPAGSPKDVRQDTGGPFQPRFGPGSAPPP